MSRIFKWWRHRFPLTPTLTAWPLSGHTALKSILWATLFLYQLHNFLLLSLNSFLHSFLKLKFMKKILDTKIISNADFHKPTYTCDPACFSGMQLATKTIFTSDLAKVTKSIPKLHTVAPLFSHIFVRPKKRWLNR